MRLLATAAQPTACTRGCVALRTGQHAHTPASGAQADCDGPTIVVR